MVSWRSRRPKPLWKLGYPTSGSSSSGDLMRVIPLISVALSRAADGLPGLASWM